MTDSAETHLRIQRLMPHFAVEVTGVDLSRPVDDTTLAALVDLIAREAVVVVRDQDLNDEQQVNFSQRLGRLETFPTRGYLTASQYPQIAVVSNVDPATGQLMPPADRRMTYNDANALWHSDSSFRKVPAVMSLLSARQIPPSGGNTEFADMRVVWDELPDARKAHLEKLVAEHSLMYSRRRLGQFEYSASEQKELKPVRQPLVRVHPATGRKAFFIGSHAGRVLALPAEESAALLNELLVLGTRADRLYSHAWREKDLVIWDNRSVLHRGTPYLLNAHRRIMHRTTVSEPEPLIPQGPTGAQ